MAERYAPLPTLLYVENDPNDQLLLIHTAARAQVHFSIQAFSDFKAARDYISGYGPFRDREAYPFPVLALMDFDLGNWCGLSLIKWIRRNVEFSHLTIVMFSDRGLDGRFSDCYKHGADHCLEKPMNIAGMEQMILCLDRCICTMPMSFAELKTLSRYYPNKLRDHVLA